ncbi:UDP-2,4-diacetamido-2,4,6-trideoxy-beta-L-altropyranose hydrolase [Gallaecimonas sp. GXIMD4217]|uniref:UDP-2,4-diacetamido-2,4, 6-trideoxy-beta-L-altropyranose hydrolase n=1 Tax=Gallaecimonas sp. GXIMD4217 TaxID=3131927 RepID=UPI00311B302E
MTDGMPVAFRVDACPAIGAGHLHRCLHLARALAELGARVRFLIRPHPQSLHGLVEEAGFGLELLPPPHWQVKPAESLDSHKAWLGKTAAEDAAETARLLNGDDLLVCDHYGIDEPWLAPIRDRCRLVAALDDTASRRLGVDVLINSLPSARADDYRDLIRPDTQLLLGADYVPLGASWPVQRAGYRPGDSIDRVLFCPGGTDPFGLSERLLPHLVGAAPDVQFHLALHAPPQRQRQLRLALDGLGNVRCHFALTDLAGLAAGMDLAIGNAGSGAWERACLGLAQIAIRTTPDQHRIAHCLAEQALAPVFDQDDAALVDKVLAAFLALRDNPRQRQQLADNGKRLIDGRGCSRIARILAARYQDRGASHALVP